MNKKIIITTGDTDGIGLEVTVKSLKRILSECPATLDHIDLYIFLQSTQRNFVLSQFKSAKFIKNEDLYSLDHSSGSINWVINDESPAQWIWTAAEKCKSKFFDAMVTGPLSKTLIKESGFSEIGHTEILKKVSAPNENLYMTFFGSKFSVVSLTGHIPLSEIPNALNKPDLLYDCVKKIVTLQSTLSDTRPIAILGLNPHAGESGLLGDYEKTHLIPQLEKIRSEFGYNAITNPLVPDAAFLPNNWEKYFMFLCLYHDQALIPFKMTHQHLGGCQYSLGLPFTRTSVEHGTAKDLFGKDCASEMSMFDAIHWALRLS